MTDTDTPAYTRHDLRQAHRYLSGDIETTTAEHAAAVRVLRAVIPEPPALTIAEELAELSDHFAPGVPRKRLAGLIGRAARLQDERDHLAVLDDTRSAEHPAEETKRPAVGDKIETPEVAINLPVGTRVTDMDGDRATRMGNGWRIRGGTPNNRRPSRWFEYPITIDHMPEDTDA